MATELGQAYVQIMPSAKGISGKIKEAIDPEATSAGKSAGGSLVGGIKKAIAVAGIGLAIKSAITEGAALQQSIGGIETLFKDSANTMRKYADEAYRTVGVSANDYMQNVTSFSASLLQSLGGDTGKAAEVANKAMIDMGDNANKMGTNMQDIQNAYQGFAKQNYTMLDNLKLGYGGTKTEMQRLLADAQKLTGVKYNIDNLSDVYTAIGVIQDQLGITGTTALEAESTLTGSLNAMQSAFKNTLGKLAIGEDIKPSLNALASTVSTFLFKNLMPMVWNIVSALPGAVITIIQESLPFLIEAGGEILRSLQTGLIEGGPMLFDSINNIVIGAVDFIKNSFPGILSAGVEFISNFVSGIMESMPYVIDSVGAILTNVLDLLFEIMPQLLDAGMELIQNVAQGIWDNLPAIIDSVINVIDSLLSTFVENYPEYFKKGWEIIGQLAQGIWDNLPQIISTVVDLIVRLIKTIGSHLPTFLAKGIEIIAQLAWGLIKAIPDLVSKIPQIIGSILGGFGSLAGALFDVGVDAVKGLWQGILNVKDWILRKISGFVDNIIGGIKGFFGIASPSKVMAKEVGKFLPEGLAVGIEGNIKPLTDTMVDLGNSTISSFNPDFASVSTNLAPSGNGMGDKLDQMISLFDAFVNNPPKYYMVTDTGVLAGEMAPKIDESLSKLEDRRRRGG